MQDLCTPDIKNFGPRIVHMCTQSPLSQGQCTYVYGHSSLVLTTSVGQCNVTVVVVLCVLGHSSLHRYSFVGSSWGGGN
jgi:hypothetical protein